MSKRRKSYSTEFKTKVVLELLREEESASAIASRYGVSVQTLNQWKKKFLENAALAKTLGKTTIERDWAVGKQTSPQKSIPPQTLCKR